MISLVVCRGIRAEVDQVLTKAGITDVQLETCRGNCRQGRLGAEDRAWLEEHRGEDSRMLLLGQCPVDDSMRLRVVLTHHRVEDIAELFIGRDAYQALLDDRCFVVTGGWVSEWETNVSYLGLDAKAFDPQHGGTMVELVMLETSFHSSTHEKLEALSRYVGLPARTVNVGLDMLEALLRLLIMKVRDDEAAVRLKGRLDIAEVMIADYAMAFDLLGSISQAQGEEGVIRSIMSLFEMLFSPRTVRYTALDGDTIIRTHSTGPACGTAPDLSWTKSGRSFEETEDGFSILIEDRGHALGVVEVMNMGFPENRRRYLNLAVNMSGAFALAVSNSRAIQGIKRSEEAMKHRLKVESLISETSTRFASNHDHVEAARESARRILSFAPADRINVLSYDHRSGSLETWVATESGDLRSLPVEPALLDAFKRYKSTTVIDGHGTEVELVRGMLSPPGTRSLLIAPLIMDKSFTGLLLMESGSSVNWDWDVRTVVQILAENVIAVLKRQEDRDEMARLNDSLRVTNKIMRHDIRNELTATQGFVQLFTIKNDERYLQKAMDSIDKVHMLLEQMKEVDAFLLSGDGLRPLDLRGVIAEVLPGYNIRSRIEGDAKILGDGAMSSVIDNLIRNAVVHGRATAVDIDIRTKGIGVEIRVRDNGKGIPAAALKKVFQEGFSYGEKRGTGIGLFLVRKTMERYGGGVTVEETSPHGTTFLLRLPWHDHTQV